MLPSTLLPLLLGALQCASAAPTGGDKPILIPKPSGEYNVSVAHIPINDPTTIDPYAPLDSKHDRTLMISLFYPIKNCTQFCQSPYMPSDTASTFNSLFYGDPDVGAFDTLKFQSCCKDQLRADPKRFPLVVLDPAFGTSRLLYGAIAQHIAGNGYAVVTIDHPYDAAIVEFPHDSSSDSNNPPTLKNSIKLNPFAPVNPWNGTVTNATNTRISDFNLVIQRLGDPRVVKQLLPTAPEGSSFNTSLFGFVGHGLGGSVATWLQIDDGRVAIAVNLDGTPPLVQQDLPSSIPIVFFGRDDHTRDNDIHWPETWKHITGPAWEWNMKDSAFFDYSDLPLIANLTADITETKVKDVKGLGGIDGRRAFNATSQWASGYMKAWLNPGKEGRMVWQGLLGLYTEVMPYVGKPNNPEVHQYI